ncbi:MAG: LytTR family transcriptional regulator [Cytophagales bacterium]|nr:LytTR family transcriptional regulator [Cytophagales bacterium]
MKNQEINVGGRRAVKPGNVILFEGDANYSHVHLKNGSKITVATTLKRLEERFRPFNFYRSHKKYLINIREVQCCENYEVELKNNHLALVSRRKKDELVRILIKSR